MGGKLTSEVFSAGVSYYTDSFPDLPVAKKVPIVGMFYTDQGEALMLNAKTAAGKMTVLFLRDVTNRADKNAIRAYAWSEYLQRIEMVGYVQRHAASDLAKLMDSTNISDKMFAVVMQLDASDVKSPFGYNFSGVVDWKNLNTAIKER